MIKQIHAWGYTYTLIRIHIHTLYVLHDQTNSRKGIHIHANTHAYTHIAVAARDSAVFVRTQYCQSRHTSRSQHHASVSRFCAQVNMCVFILFFCVCICVCACRHTSMSKHHASVSGFCAQVNMCVLILFVCVYICVRASL